MLKSLSVIVEPSQNLKEETIYNRKKIKETLIINGILLIPNVDVISNGIKNKK